MLLKKFQSFWQDLARNQHVRYVSAVFFSVTDNLTGRLCSFLHILSVNNTQLYKMNHVFLHFTDEYS